ncbi:hypothetical protein INT46_008587 [Mucor plumbeus]|uniref:Uncharacterized protein n=1 Tax=Mucor plumbeus TaxID=97098 RepID=A0A8H7QD22_9FUNG|nr:hypothetical protein INT46_008587 [Mucor plumbeus]
MDVQQKLELKINTPMASMDVNISPQQ